VNLEIQRVNQLLLAWPDTEQILKHRALFLIQSLQLFQLLRVRALVGAFLPVLGDARLPDGLGTGRKKLVHVRNDDIADDLLRTAHRAEIRNVLTVIGGFDLRPTKGRRVASVFAGAGDGFVARWALAGTPDGLE